MVGSLFQVGAQVNSKADTSYQNSALPPTPSQNSIISVASKEELDVIVSSDHECAGQVNSYLLGVVPGVIDSINNLMFDDSFQITCASVAMNKGDLRPLATLYENQQNSKGLVSAITAVNGKLLDQRPASGAGFIQGEIYALQNLGKVSAQDEETANQDLGLYYPGLGYELLRPVQSFWGWSVAIVYSILILVIIVVALGIMFRANLNGGIAVALQTAIPNIALAMILVPLSYAITGLFIDGITVGVNATHLFLIGPGSPGHGVYEEAINDNELVFEVGGDYVNRGLHADDAKVSWLYSGIALAHPIGEGTKSFGAAIGGAAGSTGLIAGVGSFIESVLNADWLISILTFVLGVILLLTGVRIFWKLMKKYIYFITMPLFSPFVFATVAMPGGGMNSVIWYAKQMGSATLAYIVTYAMILLSIVFSSTYFLNQLPQAGVSTFVPPLTAIESVLLDFSSNVNQSGATTSFIQFVFIFAAFGIYMLIPKTLDQIDEALGVGKAPEFLADILQSTKDSIGVGRAGLALPGQVGGGVYKGGAAAVGAAQNARNWQARARQGLSNIYDRRVRGIDAGSQWSSARRNFNKLASEKGQAQRELRDAQARGDKYAARQAQGRIANLDRQMNNIKESAGISDANKEFKEVAMKVEVSWNGQKGPIVFTRDMIESLQAMVTAGKTAVDFYKGKISLSIEGGQFPPSLVAYLGLYKVADASSGPNYNTKMRSDPITGDVQIPPGGLLLPNGAPRDPADIQGLNRFFSFGSLHSTLQFDNIERYTTGNGMNYEFGFMLKIASIPGFLQDIGVDRIIKSPWKYKFILPDPVGGEKNPDGTPKAGGYGDIESNEFDIMITGQFG